MKFLCCSAIHSLQEDFGQEWNSLENDGSIQFYLALTSSNGTTHITKSIK